MISSEGVDVLDIRYQTRREDGMIVYLTTIRP